MAQNFHTAQEAFLSLRRGEEEGFAWFFQHLYEALLYFALKHLEDPDVAEDVVEESFARLWQHRESLLYPSAVKSYLYTSVRNACIDLQRKQKNAVHYTKHEQATGETQSPPALHRLIEAEVLRELAAALEGLPPLCRTVVEGFYLEGKALKEIAGELGLTVDSVKGQKVKALKLLRKRLGSLPVLLLTAGCFLSLAT